MSEGKKTLISKLVEIVRQIDHVEKSGRNDFQKYNYVRAADVAWMVRKALSERNVYLVSDVVEVRNYEIPAREGVMQAVDVKMEFSFFDADDPAATPIVLHSYGTGTDKGDKAVYKAMTGALKYGLRNAFMIPDESDPEADTSVDKATSTKAAKAVGEQKVADLKAKAKNYTPALFYTWFNESQTARIEGDQDLMTTHRELLKKYYNAAVKAVVVNAEQLEDLKYHFDKISVPFKLLKSVGEDLTGKLQESLDELNKKKANGGAPSHQ